MRKAIQTSLFLLVLTLAGMAPSEGQAFGRRNAGCREAHPPDCAPVQYIEQTVTLGAHGPYRVHIVLLAA